MSNIITKKTLDQSLTFFKELNFEESDYEKIMEKFKKFFEDPGNKKILKDFLLTKNLTPSETLLNIMKKIIENNNITYFNLLLQKLLKNDKLIDEIQDIFLEKLL